MTGSHCTFDGHGGRVPRSRFLIGGISGMPPDIVASKVS